MFLALSVIGLALSFLLWPIGRGMVSFFTGALVGVGLGLLVRSGWYLRAPGQVLLTALALGAVVLLGIAALPVLAGLHRPVDTQQRHGSPGPPPATSSSWWCSRISSCCWV